MFKKVEINIPFVEALAQIPNCSKFMKDFISKKMKIYDYGTMNLSANYSAIIQRRMPQKMQNPRSFTIPCAIGNHEFRRALYDLGVITAKKVLFYTLINIGFEHFLCNTRPN